MSRAHGSLPTDIHSTESEIVHPAASAAGHAQPSRPPRTAASAVPSGARLTTWPAGAATHTAQSASCRSAGCSPPVASAAAARGGGRGRHRQEDGWQPGARLFLDAWHATQQGCGTSPSRVGLPSPHTLAAPGTHTHIGKGRQDPRHLVADGQLDGALRGALAEKPDLAPAAGTQTGKGVCEGQSALRRARKGLGAYHLVGAGQVQMSC